MLVYRLNPALNTKPKRSMFELRDATGLELRIGQHWVDDYLEAPSDPEMQKLVESLMREDGFFFERMEKYL